MSSSLELTEQLRRFSSGDASVAEAVLREVLPRLHQIAVRELGRERRITPLQPTELINEVWLRNLGRGGWKVNDRDHFYAIAALAMRRVLIDFARTRLGAKHGSGQVAEQLDEGIAVSALTCAHPESLIETGILMERLETADIEAARIVDLHYFAGFTLQEAAVVTGLTFRQVRHRWERGSNWLKDRLT